MVNIPSVDKLHVISAWIVAKEKMLRKMSNRDFFINFENKKKGRRLSDSLVPSKGIAKHRVTDKFTEKPMPHTGHGTFRSLVLVT